MTKDKQTLPVLKIPCRVVRNPTYFTKYLPESEKRELNNSRASLATQKPEKVKLPPVLGKSVKKEDVERNHKPFRYNTAYGDSFLVKQLLDRELNITDLANVYVKYFPKAPSRNAQHDFYTYKPKIKREFQLWESRKGVKYYQGDIDKRLVAAKQRINKTWKQEMREYFRKERKKENILLRKAESMDKGLKAYLKNVDRQLKKYESDDFVKNVDRQVEKYESDELVKIRKCSAMDDVTKPTLKNNKRTSLRQVRLKPPDESETGNFEKIYLSDFGKLYNTKLG